MSRARSLAAAASAVVLFLSVSACGGDDDKPLTSAQFKDKVLDICKKFNDKVDDLDPGDSASPGDLEAAVKKVADALEDEADEIDKLEPPKKIEDDVEAMLEALEDGAEKIRDNAGDITKLTENPLEEASKKADELGLSECAS